MTTTTATRRVAEATECDYCGFAESEGAVLVAMTLRDAEWALCRYCADDRSEGPLCDFAEHDGICDCRCGYCD